MNEKMSKVDILLDPGKFEDLKDALNEIGITGMTVSNVLGCGMQKGHKEFYRGTEVNINLLQKVKVEIVVCEIPVDTVVETVKKYCIQEKWVMVRYLFMM